MCICLHRHHLSYSHEDDLDIHPKGLFLDVDEVLIEAGAHVACVQCAAAIAGYLCKTSNARFYHIAIVEIVESIIPMLAFIYRIRARTDKAHFAFHHIEDLWKFIQICFSEQTAKRENPGVSFCGDIRRAVQCLAIYDVHRPEFIAHKLMPAQTGSVLLTNDGALGGKLDSQCYKRI